MIGIELNVWLVELFCFDDDVQSGCGAHQSRPNRAVERAGNSLEIYLAPIFTRQRLVVCKHGHLTCFCCARTSRSSYFYMPPLKRTLITNNHRTSYQHTDFLVVAFFNLFFFFIKFSIDGLPSVREFVNISTIRNSDFLF